MIKQMGIIAQYQTGGFFFSNDESRWFCLERVGEQSHTSIFI